MIDGKTKEHFFPGGLNFFYIWSLRSIESILIDIFIEYYYIWFFLVLIVLLLSFGRANVIWFRTFTVNRKWVRYLWLIWNQCMHIGVMRKLVPM